MLPSRQSQKQQFLQDINTYNTIIEMKFGSKILINKLPNRSEYHLLFRNHLIVTCYNQEEVNKFIRAFAEFAKC